MKFVAAPDATPLDPQVIIGLKPNISTQEELNEFEADNIAAALRWVATSRILKRGYPTVTALLRLHKKMFDRTWKMGGQVSIDRDHYWHRALSRTDGIAKPL